MARSDSGALAASRSMTASAAAAKSSGSATRAMRPRSYMRCAGIGSPRSSISLASTGPPTSISFLARNQEGASPICASDIPNVARVEATTMSQCSASSLPPAMAGPCTTATTGRG